MLRSDVNVYFQFIECWLTNLLYLLFAKLEFEAIERERERGIRARAWGEILMPITLPKEEVFGGAHWRAGKGGSLPLPISLPKERSIYIYIYIYICIYTYFFIHVLIICLSIYLFVYLFICLCFCVC